MVAHAQTKDDRGGWSVVENQKRRRLTAASVTAFDATMLHVHEIEVRAFLLAIFVIEHFLGRAWLEKHVFVGDRPAGIFGLEDDDGGSELAILRMSDLGECLLNLQHVDGFEEIVERMRAANNPEAGMAELHIAKLLYIHDWEFRFIVPKGKKGEDYDLEINYHGQTVCADTKCKTEATTLSASTITNTLQGSRNQLPAHGPGVFFMKLPEQWMYDPEFASICDQGVEDFFSKGTGRIV